MRIGDRIATREFDEAGHEVGQTMTPGVQIEPTLLPAEKPTWTTEDSVLASGAMSAGDERPGTLGFAVAHRTLLAGSVTLGLLLALMYWKIAVKLVTDWYQIADYSHGFLVPFFALFLLWDKRQKLTTMRIEPASAGIALVLLGVLTLFFGVYGAELFLSRFSFVLIVSGLIWTFLGRAILREVLFPIAVLMLAIPFPEIIFNQITFPLQLLASKCASALLPLLGVPVFREGNVIQLPVMKLEVAEACSGIRSLMSLFTLSVFYGYFLERTTGRRWLMALASIPIAVCANALRIVGTGLCVQYWDPSKAEGFFHEFSGWVMFVISLGCLYLLHRILRLVWPVKVSA